MNDLKAIADKMKERLAWSDTSLLRAVLAFLETQTWIRQHQPTSSVDSLLLDDSEDTRMQKVKDAVELLSSHFRIPLERKGASLIALQDEIEEAVSYARTYLSIQVTGYKTVWYKLSTCPDSRKWPNVLMLCELAFSLPFSNSRVEQIFSSLKLVKTNRRTNMSSSTLTDLMEIFVEGPPVSSFCADHAIRLWWADSKRRVNQQPRKQYTAHKPKPTDCQPQSSDSEHENDEESNS